MHANSVSTSIKSVTTTSYIPSFCFGNSLVDEDVEGDEDEDGPELSGDERMDAVEDCVVPANEALIAFSYY